MFIREVWIVNKMVSVGWCDVPECKGAPAVYGGWYMYTEILCLISLKCWLKQKDIITATHEIVNMK